MKNFRSVNKISKNECYFCHACPSVRPMKNNSAPIGRIFMKFYFCWFSQNLWRKFKFYENNEYYIRRQLYFHHISLSASQNEKIFRKKVEE